MTLSTSRFLTLIVFSILMGLTTASFAKNKKNRDPNTWFIYGFMFGCLGFIFLLFLPRLEKREMPLKKEAVLTVDLSPKLPMKKALWYFLDENKTQIGPVSFERLKNHFQEGSLKASSYVWNASMSDWETLQTLPEYLNEITSDHVETTS